MVVHCSHSLHYNFIIIWYQWATCTLNLLSPGLLQICINYNLILNKNVLYHLKTWCTLTVIFIDALSFIWFTSVIIFFMPHINIHTLVLFTTIITPLFGIFSSVKHCVLYPFEIGLIITVHAVMRCDMPQHT